MIKNDVGRGQSARCPAATSVTVTEWAKLAALPNPLDPVRLGLTCELAIGHEERHVGFVVAAGGGDQLWWLRWAKHLRDVAQMELCDGKDIDGQDDCLLPYRHQGPHSFDIRPIQQSSCDAPPTRSRAHRATPGWPVAPARHQRGAR